MAKYISTILKIAIHTEDMNPVFGETVTHVGIEDDAAGPFIVLSQCHDESKEGEVRVDFEELEQIYLASKVLIDQFKDVPHE